MDIQFKEGIQAEITCVPNAFIDELLAEANGDYVRVYLYLLRHCKENMKVHSVADSLISQGPFLIGKRKESSRKELQE